MHPDNILKGLICIKENETPLTDTEETSSEDEFTDESSEDEEWLPE